MSDATEIIQAAARVLIDAALRELQGDPHPWSERPCATCRTVSSIVGRPFGCYVYAEQRAAQKAVRAFAHPETETERTETRE